MELEVQSAGQHYSLRLSLANVGKQIPDGSSPLHSGQGLTSHPGSFRALCARGGHSLHVSLNVRTALLPLVTARGTDMQQARGHRECPSWFLNSIKTKPAVTAAGLWGPPGVGRRQAPTLTARHVRHPKSLLAEPSLSFYSSHVQTKGSYHIPDTALGAATEFFLRLPETGFSPSGYGEDTDAQGTYRRVETRQERTHVHLTPKVTLLPLPRFPSPPPEKNHHVINKTAIVCPHLGISRSQVESPKMKLTGPDPPLYEHLPHPQATLQVTCPWAYLLTFWARVGCSRPQRGAQQPPRITRSGLTFLGSHPGPGLLRDLESSGRRREMSYSRLVSPSQTD